MSNHPHAIEEDAFAFSRLYPDHNGNARAQGHCCATASRGGDCAHSMAGYVLGQENEEEGAAPLKPVTATRWDGDDRIDYILSGGTVALRINGDEAAVQDADGFAVYHAEVDGYGICCQEVPDGSGDRVEFTPSPAWAVLLTTAARFALTGCSICMGQGFQDQSCPDCGR